MNSLTRLAAIMAMIFTSLGTLSAAGAGGYHLLSRYPFGPAEGSTREYFDYITVDSAARRVYLSHGTEVLVMDADSGKLVGRIRGLKQDHGVALAREFNRGFITDGAGASVMMVDLKSLRTIGEAKADHDADSIVYDPASKRVFVMNGDPNSSTVIDAKTGRVVGTVALGGAPEFAVADGNGTVFINIESKNEIVALDSHTLNIKARWPVAPAGGPTALAMDIPNRRLFCAGRDPQKLVVLNADNGNVIQSFPISAGVDAAAFDPGTGIVLVSTREGMLHIFHEDSPDQFSEVETVKTEFGAKTMGLDTKTHRVFLDTADFAPAAASTQAQPHPRRNTIPGTFHVLVYGPLTK